MIEPFLTKREVALKLRVSPKTVQRLDLPHMRVGGQNRYLWSEVLAALKTGDPDGAKVVPFPTEKGAA